MNLILSEHSYVDLTNIRQRERIRILYADFSFIRSSERRTSYKLAAMDYKLSNSGEIYQPTLVDVRKGAGSPEECAMETFVTFLDCGCCQLSIENYDGLSQVISSELQHSAVRGKRFTRGSYRDVLGCSRQITFTEETFGQWMNGASVAEEIFARRELRHIHNSNPDDFAPSVSESDITELFEG